MSTQWSGTLFASEEETNTAAETQASTPAARVRLTLDSVRFTADPSPAPFAQGAHATFNFIPAPSNAFAGQIYQGRPYRIGHDRSIAVIMIGALASITGAAILVYANRPECSTDRFAGGCGYGAKVVGGAVLSGGIAGLFVGALTWN
jgi:hypothetical protein